jgi:hypothetical protein
MDEIIAAIRDATRALPTPQIVAAEDYPVSKRDWQAFFAALADFAAKLLPLLIPLFAKPEAK